MARLREKCIRIEFKYCACRQVETIKIIDGPFNVFNAVIEEVNDEKKKLKVQVKIFGRATPVELSYMQVEKLA